MAEEDIVSLTPGRTGDAARAPSASRPVTDPYRAQMPGLPASTTDIATDAAAQLGWPGDVLDEATIMSRPVHVCARLLSDAHAERIATGAAPSQDRAEVATWAWPEMADVAPRAAVEITGVLSVARHWRTALAWAVPFARYAPVAMVLPASLTISHDFVDNALPRARAFGVNVLTVDDDGLVHRDLAPERIEPAAADDGTGRWINELVYRLVADKVTV